MTPELFSRSALLPGALLALLAAPPARAQYEPPKQMTLSPTGVDLTTGHFTHKAVDFSIGPFTLERSYVGGHPVDGSNLFGRNWTHNHSIYVVEKNRDKPDGVYIVMGRDIVHFTSYFTAFSCRNPDCMGATLEVVDQAFVYTDRQGNVYRFNPAVNAFPPPGNLQPPLRNQRIARIDYADGHTVTYSYSGTQLTQIASNYGYSLVFEYGPSGYISRACGYNRATTYLPAEPTCAGAALAASYGYSGAPWTTLATVTDPLGHIWGYDYLGDSNVSNMTCVRQVNFSACLIANQYPFPRVVRQTTADGAVWETHIERPDPDDPQLPGEPPAYSEGRYTGPEGISVVAEFGGGLLNSYSENGRATSLTWNGLELETLTHPEGNKVGYYRDGRQNVVLETWTPKPGSTDASTVSRTTGYPDPDSVICPSVPRKICNKPIWRKDYNGHRTDFTYDPDHGGVLTETGPQVGGVRPQVRYTYEPRRAWVRTAAGGYEQVAEPIHLPVRKSFCASGAAAGAGCATAGDEVVTTYDYGPGNAPNNLALRSETVTSNGVTRRTCYGYEAQGNRTPMRQRTFLSATAAPLAFALSSLGGAAGAQALSSEGTYAVRYDALRRETGTIAPDADGAAPFLYPATRKTWNAAGHLVAIESGFLSSWPGHAAPADWSGFTVHERIDADSDAMGRKTREQVNGDAIVARVTEYGHDGAGRLKCAAVRMNPDAWATPLADKCAPGPAHPVHGPDRITRNSYDPRGQLLKIEKAVGTALRQDYAAYTYSPNGKPLSVTDANGNRSEMVWDGLDRQRRLIFPSKTAAGAANPADYEEYGYDPNGNRRSLRRRDGQVISYEYDALNRVVVKDVPGLMDVRYTYDLRGLRTGAWFTANSQGVWNVYDGFGQPLSATTNMGGAARALAYTHDPNGNRLSVQAGSGHALFYVHDGLDRVTRVEEAGGYVVARIAGL